MYLRVFKEDIFEGVMKASSIVSQKTGASYLRTVWLKAEEETLSIMSTDSNMEFTGVYKASVLENGIVGVGGKKFNELIKKLKPGEIIFKADMEQNVLIIQQEKRRYKVPTTDSSWFPEMESFPGENNVLWSGEIIKEIIEKSFFCISDDDTMGGMTCLKMVPVSGDQVENCGFNGHNMSLYTFRNDSVYEILPAQGLLIPKKYLVELRKWLILGEVELSVSPERFFIRTEDMKECISLPLSFDDYPDYHEIIDKYKDSLSSVLKINRVELMESLERILIFSTELNKSALFRLSPEEVEMVSTAVEAGEANEVLNCSFQGDLEEIVFNVKSLLEILGHFNSKEVELHFSGQVGPCKVIGLDDPDYFVVTMPVEIEEDTYYTEEEE
ncbi:DNA polymerase III subunit beta [Desulfonatronovibrio hydrogenovorans]|uniref:DNA polymerase III subunit beta n=1 Tax=Desulfonatronovibrio hydrogenovorans TaxID=53245 RepID=UPI000491FFD9|nr:DNA polymerase III subunit beta [Desulfonatronovibrio hydrogenovorans]